MEKVAILKLNPEKRQVFGWASVSVRIGGEQIIDVQEDMIDMEDLEKAAYEYVLHFGVAGEMHENPNVGRLIESLVFTKEKAEALGIPEHLLPEGWWVGFYIEDEMVWEKVKNGTYTMFSIEGTAMREAV